MELVRNKIEKLKIAFERTKTEISQIDAAMQKAQARKNDLANLYVSQQGGLLELTNLLKELENTKKKPEDIKIEEKPENTESDKK